MTENVENNCKCSSFKTLGGSDALVFMTTDTKMIGAYKASENEWYPVGWDLNGKFIGVGSPRSCDLVLDTPTVDQVA